MPVIPRNRSLSLWGEINAMETRLLPRRSIVTNIYTFLKPDPELGEQNPVGNEGLAEVDFRGGGRHVREDGTILPNACFL